MPRTPTTWDKSQSELKWLLSPQLEAYHNLALVSEPHGMRSLNIRKSWQK